MSQIDTFLKGRPSRDPAIPAAAVLSAPDPLAGIRFRCWLAGFPTRSHGPPVPASARVPPPPSP